MEKDEAVEQGRRLIPLSLDDVDILDDALNEYIETMTPRMADLRQLAEDLSDRINTHRAPLLDQDMTGQKVENLPPEVSDVPDATF